MIRSFWLWGAPGGTPGTRKGGSDVKNKPLKLSPNQSIALGFLAIILAGALLLMLPAANRTGQSLSFLDSLFTATSAWLLSTSPRPRDS